MFPTVFMVCYWQQNDCDEAVLQALWDCPDATRSTSGALHQFHGERISDAQSNLSFHNYLFL
jgi:hypothetical protein